MTAFRQFDPANYINSMEEAALNLTFAAEDHEPGQFISALGDVARAYSMGKIADAVGVSRESLYRSLGPSGNPRFATVMNALTAMGLELQVVVAQPRRECSLDAVAVDQETTLQA